MSASVDAGVGGLILGQMCKGKPLSECLASFFSSPAAASPLHSKPLLFITQNLNMIEIKKKGRHPLSSEMPFDQLVFRISGTVFRLEKKRLKWKRAACAPLLTPSIHHPFLIKLRFVCTSELPWGACWNLTRDGGRQKPERRACIKLVTKRQPKKKFKIRFQSYREVTFYQCL